MRSIRIDPYAFDNPASEASLLIDLSRPSEFPHPDVKAFVGAVVSAAAASSLHDSIPFYRISQREKVSEYLKCFASMDLPVHA